MDLRQYFRKIREAEKGLVDSYPVVVSLETADGGKPGVVSEVSREVAAQLIVEGRAVLANDEQREAYIVRLDAAKRAAEKMELARRVQVAIIADPELQNTVVNRKSYLPGSGK